MAINLYDPNFLKELIKYSKWALTTKDFGGYEFDRTFPHVTRDFTRMESDRAVVIVPPGYDPVILRKQVKDEVLVYNYHQTSLGPIGKVNRYFEGKELWHFADIERGERVG